MKCFSNLPSSDLVSVSVITIYELYYGLENNKLANDRYSIVRKNIGKVLNLFGDPLPLTVVGAQIFGRLKAQYRTSTGMNPRALKKHNFDLVLASIAIEQQAVIVSNDRIYAKLCELNPTLKYENWAT